MSLVLHFHPLASYCWKVLLALYENETPFEPSLVDLATEEQRAALASLWPIAKFPVLEDRKRSTVVPESSIIIEYLAQYYPGKVELVPDDPEQARHTRLCDRFYDLYVHEPMQKIVGDRLRPAEQRDSLGVAQARATLERSYAMIESKGLVAAPRRDGFSLADCAAGPALYYANRVHPFGGGFPEVARYLERLLRRPSFERVLAEAEPYFRFFPG